jgi:hypothetical protein
MDDSMSAYLTKEETESIKRAAEERRTRMEAEIQKRRVKRDRAALRAENETLVAAFAGRAGEGEA